MTKLHIIPQKDLPGKWHTQILSFLRSEWPEGFVGENESRDWITRETMKPVSIFIVQEDSLISHVQVVSKVFTHLDENFKFYGLTGMFTYPEFRKQGYGTQIVQEGMKYISEQNNKDIIFYSCEEKNVDFYSKCGWLFNDIPILEGKLNDSQLTESRVAMEFVSQKAKKYKEDFKSNPLFFGDELW